MNLQEFDQFMNQAGAAYPGIETHFGKIEKPLRPSARKMWFEALEHVELRHASDVISQMVAGDIETPNFGWADFPKIVRREAKQLEILERARVPDEGDLRDSVRCHICHDDSLGMVRVWNPWFVEHCSAKILECVTEFEARQVHRKWRIRKGRGFGGIHLAAACTCDSRKAEELRAKFQDWLDKAGPERAKWVRANGSPGVVGVYAREKFCIWTEHDPKVIVPSFVSWSESRLPQDIPGRVEAFDQWNAGGGGKEPF